MNNHSNEKNTDNSPDKTKSPAFKVLESNAEKFLMVWWYGALAKADRRNAQPKKFMWLLGNFWKITHPQIILFLLMQI